MSSEDPPAYEPPGPEITGEPADVEDNKKPGENFKDEPAAGEYNEQGDPAKCNFSPMTIIILVILNLLALGLVGYLIWYAVDQSKNTPAPTRAPSPPPTPAPTRSMAPTNLPSVSSNPTGVRSLSPTMDTTPAPSMSGAPSATHSTSPSAGPFQCNLCGEGKTMDTANLGGSITFGTRVTRTCQELLTDQNNGDILEEQCIQLYSDISTTCGCVALTGTTSARDDTTVTTLLRNTVGSTIDAANTDEANALAALLDSATDTYYAANKSSMTDDEVLERYLMILAHFQMNAESYISYAAETCSWSTVTYCPYGHVGAVDFNSNIEPAASTPTFPSDLISIPYVESIVITGYNFQSTIPSTLPTNDYLTILDLPNNGLTGTIPDALFELRSLVELNLSGNSLSGNLGDKNKIKQLIRLDYLDLGYNSFTGTLPTCELSTTPATLVTDCASEVSCTCCSACADSTTGTV